MIIVSHKIFFIGLWKDQIKQSGKWIYFDLKKNVFDQCIIIIKVVLTLFCYQYIYYFIFEFWLFKVIKFIVRKFW